MYSEDELVPLSALQHIQFCERQCALIHIERLWAENRLTAEGRNLHERADSCESESRGSVRTVRSLPLTSLRLGLTGKADVVEFHYSASVLTDAIPIEYKRGNAKLDDSDRVQLCAQALCLEEMLSIPVLGGALFYATPRRRTDVSFDAELRRITEDAAVRLHKLLDAGVTPRVPRQPKCDGCSLFDLCMPEVTDKSTSASVWCERAIVASLDAQ